MLKTHLSERFGLESNISCQMRRWHLSQVVVLRAGGLGWWADSMPAH